MACSHLSTVCMSESLKRVSKELKFISIYQQKLWRSDMFTVYRPCPILSILLKQILWHFFVHLTKHEMYIYLLTCVYALCHVDHAMSSVIRQFSLFLSLFPSVKELMHAILHDASIQMSWRWRNTFFLCSFWFNLSN